MDTANGAPRAEGQPQAAAAPQQPGEAHRNGIPTGKGKGRSHAEDASAAELLLGFGSAESEGGDSGGGSSSGGEAPKAAPAAEVGQAAVAAAGEEDNGEEDTEEDEAVHHKGCTSSRGLRRSSRQARTPSVKANEMLNTGSGLSDDEFEPAPAKRPPKGEGGGLLMRLWSTLSFWGPGCRCPSMVGCGAVTWWGVWPLPGGASAAATAAVCLCPACLPFCLTPSAWVAVLLLAPQIRRPGAAARAAAPSAAPAKSELTVLCERFQQQFGYLQPDGSPNLLMLNDVAEQLGVPRRRLYDVINVFESIEVGGVGLAVPALPAPPAPSWLAGAPDHAAACPLPRALQVMRRVGKLMYEWVGFDHLPTLMEQLAAEEESGVPVEDRIRRAPTLVTVGDGGDDGTNSKGNSHSLWVLSRRLVRMLLKSNGPIALTAAAAVLVGPGGVSDPSQHRSQTQITVERRLYDIGSILCSVGLIERIYLKKR